MRLRDYIKAGATPPLATATVATLATEARLNGPSVAPVATVAVAGTPQGWVGRIRALPTAEGMRWDLAASALESLLRAGVVEKALGLGWDARELIGVQRREPHYAPHCAGLIWSMRPGDTVTDVRRAGAIIAYGTVRHIWKRVPLPVDGSICLPWELL